MSKVSIIIPSRAEKPKNLERTIQSIYDNATGEFEVIVGFNGPPYWNYLTMNDNYKEIRFPENIGIKGNINALAATATGKYLFKLDAHTSVGKGFDEILQQDMEEDWIVMPRFKIIKDDWSIQIRDGEEEFYDYFYLCCPFTDPRGFRFKAGGHWPERTAERDPGNPNAKEWSKNTGIELFIDETPQIHGSGWFMTKDRFFELGGFPLQDPYGHGQEPLWLALRNWLMGGKVMVNKKTWYAHLHQDSSQRGYPENRAETEKTYNFTAEHFVGNKGNYIYDFEWFIDKFSPMPTWSKNWREILHKYQEENQ